ncbi:MAG: hypothetical protein M1837_003702 [Sclerophora amabilis]|nr:MAG: hypothetical protein M1837_003702 [Sclerophora amabilis]
MASLKGPGATSSHDGSSLRIGILHARWNGEIIEALVAGAKKSLLAAGVREGNIVVQDVPGSFELPLGVQRMYAASQVQSSTSGSGSTSFSAGDLLGGSASSTDLTSSNPPTITTTTDTSNGSSNNNTANPSTSSTSGGSSAAPFDALIAIGCLIKGQTMHFEYIAEATSHGLMRVQLDLGVPVVFGVLTVLEEAQAKERAGLTVAGAAETKEKKKKKDAGEEWGEAAVELGCKRKEWGAGKLG